MQKSIIKSFAFSGIIVAPTDAGHQPARAFPRQTLRDKPKIAIPLNVVGSAEYRGLEIDHSTPALLKIVKKYSFPKKNQSLRSRLPNQLLVF